MVWACYCVPVDTGVGLSTDLQGNIKATRQELPVAKDSTKHPGRPRWAWSPSHPGVISPGGAGVLRSPLLLVYEKAGLKCQLIPTARAQEQMGYTVCPRTSPAVPQRRPLSSAPLATDCLSKQPPEEPDSFTLAPRQWNCREDSGPVAWYLPVWFDCPTSSGNRQGTLPSCLRSWCPTQAPASQVILFSLSPASFLVWSCMFMCHLPSLGCEPPQGRDCLSHLFPVLVVGTGTMQGLLGKYLVKSFPDQTGSPCTFA